MAQRGLIAEQEMIMAMVCPQCEKSFEQQLECPTCGARLQFQAKAGPTGEGQWQHTPWGRIVIGLLLAQGLAHGLRLLINAWMLANDEGAGQAIWATLPGILIMQGLYGVSLLIGGTLTGAGQDRGVLYGSFVGLVNGLIFLLIQLGRGEVLNEMALYGQPVLHLAFGAVGGLIGSLIWKPLPTVRLAVLPEFTNKVRVPVTSAADLFFASPVCWIRVLAGITVVVAGVSSSKGILGFVLEASQGKLTIESHLQAKLVIWEISAIVTLVGAGLSGVATANGLKQGLLVGIGASVVLAGIYLGNPKISTNATVYSLVSLVGLTMAGGWFGCQLFPPLATFPRRKSILTS